MGDAERDGAEAAIYAVLQPLYDQVSAFRAVEARLVLSARRAALKASRRPVSSIWSGGAQQNPAAPKSRGAEARTSS